MRRCQGEKGPWAQNKRCRRRCGDIPSKCGGEGQSAPRASNTWLSPYCGKISLTCGQPRGTTHAQQHMHTSTHTHTCKDKQFSSRVHTQGKPLPTPSAHLRPILDTTARARVHDAATNNACPELQTARRSLHPRPGPCCASHHARNLPEATRHSERSDAKWRQSLSNLQTACLATAHNYATGGAEARHAECLRSSVGRTATTQRPAGTMPTTGWGLRTA